MFISVLKWRTRFMLGALALIFALGGVATLGTSWVRDSLFRQWIAAFVEPLCSVLNTHIEHCMEMHSPEHFQEFIGHANVTEEISVISVLAPDGRTSFSSDAAAVGTLDSGFLTQESVTPVRKIVVTRADLRHGVGIHRVFAPVPNREHCWKCHDRNLAVTGYLAITVRGAAESRGRRALMIYDFLRLIPILIILGLLILFVHRFAFQGPFSAIMRGVRSIEDGNLSTRITVSAPGEMGHLAESINRMTEKRREAIAQLDAMHRQELDRAGQLATVGELAASVAHELKNPIVGIGSALDIVMDERTDLKKDPIFLEMRSETARAAKTVQDLLEFARPREPEFAPVRLDDILRNVAQYYHEQFQRQGVALTEELCTSGATIVADEELLRQVFVNLITNAFHACVPGSGAIGVRSALTPDGAHLMVTISDNGKGIPPENLERIFKPFFTTKHRGTGLGLSLSQSIVRKHGGEIRVRSQAGAGTEFTVVFPREGSGTNPGAPAAESAVLPSEGA